MEIHGVTSVEGHVAAALYDLVHVPQCPVHRYPYVFYIGDYSRVLYAGFIAEEKKCWDKLFKCIVFKEDCNADCVSEALEAIKSISVYKWDTIKETLDKLSSSVEKLHRKIREKYIEYMDRIFGFKKYFKEVHVIYGFNPLGGLMGSMLYWDEERVVVSSFTKPSMEAEQVLDLVYHEVLHGLFRLNKINVPSDVEETIIDTLMPEGFLSKILGLAKDVKKPSKDNITAMVRAYFEEKLYEKNIRLIEYLNTRSRVSYRF
ncbi:hypothetical protein J4526_07805 [Desulfurococcaceae archaeon MEX13E-LK6-19]|nr:hypothetical protein J4526_07805 [Desulfurococcaceae archaeon MEX13E-LK6-19]